MQWVMALFATQKDLLRFKMKKMMEQSGAKMTYSEGNSSKARVIS